jgi:O-antigen ligase
MLFTWILFVGIRLLFFGHHLITPLTKVFFWFWIVSLMALTLGSLIAESMNLASINLYYDGVAFIFSFVFGILITLKPQKFSKRVIAINICFTTIALTILFLFGAPFLVPWYGGSRFTGWAHNPNQLALLITIIPFLALHLLLESTNRLVKAGYILLICLSVIIGKATDSDALIVGWAIGIFVMITLTPYQKFLKSVKANQLRSKLVTIYKSLVAIFLIFGILMFLGISYEKITAASTNIYDKGQQGSDRVNLWKHGMAAIYYSPLFGLGPGAHSGVKEPFLDVEAHNTFIDWGGSAGIAGLIAYACLLGWIGWKAWQNEFIVLLAGIISLAGFSSFHFVLRHVIFWFYLLSLAGLSQKNLKNKNFRVDSTKPIKHYLEKS